MTKFYANIFFYSKYLWFWFCLAISAFIIDIVSAADANNGTLITESRLSQFVLKAAWSRFQLDTEQPALVQAAANLVVNFRDRGNAASCISAEAYNAKHRDHHMDVLNSFAQRVSPIIALSIIDVESIRKETYKTPLNVFIVDGIDGFRKINPLITPRRFRYFAYYLVIVTHNSSTPKDFLEILNFFHDKLILNVNIITRAVEHPSISIVYSYHPYLPDSCGRPKLIIHNKYKNGAFLQPSKGVFSPKLYNLHQCPLKVATFNISRFLKVVPTDDSFDESIGGTTGYKLIGFEGKLITILAETLNFTIDIVMPGEKWGEIYPNGTYTGASKLLREKDANVSIGFFVNHLNVYRKFEPSVSYFAASFAFVTPPGRPFTSLQRYVRPFQRSIWFSIIGVLVATLILQTISKLLPGSRIFGHIRTQNFVRIYLGMDIPKYPTAAFAKIFIIILIFPSLVVRFVYQCSLFYFLTANLNYAPFERLNAMFEANLRFFIEDKMLFLFDVIPGVQHRAQILKREEIRELMNRAYDWTFDGVIVTARSFVPKNIHIAKEKVLATNIVMLFPKFSFLANSFDTIILRCLNNGLIEYWSRGLERYHHEISEEYHISPMNLFQLKGLLFVGLFGYFCAFVVFLLEKASMRFPWLGKVFVKAE